MNKSIEIFKCHETATLFDVLAKINQNTKGIIFIVNQSDKLLGVLTDGDIRRALLNQVELNDQIQNYYNKECAFSTTAESNSIRLSKLSSKVKILPIVDENFVLVDYFHRDDLFQIPIAAPSLKGNEFKYLVEAFLSTWISSTGSYIEIFETNFAQFCGAKNGIAVSNGTVAIHLALLALGVGPGDEVIVPDLTFAATINTVLHAGATPVIVDVEKDGWCIDPNEIEKAITARTKAIIPVHLYGQACDMGAIMALAKKHNLYVIEDCAEAHGARFKGERVGSIGDIGCFSFFANKVITTGEGGMCTTNSDELTMKMKVLRDHGMKKDQKYYHEVIGYNYRMTNLQAAIGVAQVERIEDILEQRRLLEFEYRKILSEFDFIELQRIDLPNREKITWLVSILVHKIDREELIQKLKEARVDVRPFFYPLSKMDIYKQYVFSNTNCLRLSEIGLNLPTSLELTEEAPRKVYEILKSYQKVNG